MNRNALYSRVLKFLASLNLAVFVVIALAIATAIGTFVEAKYGDATAAAKIVYKTPWMIGILLLLAINLTAVMVDRWPWKRRHMSFVLAHIGILILLIGSVITMKWGLDGSMRVEIGGKNRHVSAGVTDLVIWSSFDGDNYTKLLEREVDFFSDPPTENPVSLQTDSGELKILDFKPYMLASRRVKAAQEDRLGSALQFNIQNARVNVTEWLVQPKKGALASHDFGPARIHLGADPGIGTGKNEVFLEPNEAGGFKYTVYNLDGLPTKKGVLKDNEKLAPGWMGLELKVVQFYPKAEHVWEFKEASRSSELTNAAIRFSFQGKEHWLQQGDIVKLFTDKAVYIVSYGMRQIDIGFDVILKNFEIGRYPGTMRAAAYQSRVEVAEVGEATISMNEPLKHKGLTIYQASFQDGPDGQPIASIFSVNHDPGRWLKYLGSLIISIGVIVLFYDRRKAAQAQLAPKRWEEE